VTLADGVDYATQALQGGYLKYSTDAASTVLQDAEAAAHRIATGLWPRRAMA